MRRVPRLLISVTCGFQRPNRRFPRAVSADFPKKGNVLKAGQVRHIVGAVLPPFIKNPLKKAKYLAKT
jgi:hypothetical protein